MKIPRFVKEYASYKIKTIQGYELMKDDKKEKAVKRITGSVKALERGLITVEESMKMITDCFEG